MSVVQRNRVAITLAIIKFLLPYLLQDPAYELHRDEYLYLAQGQHLAWGFMEVPPMLSLLAKMTYILGENFFWVKFWPSLFGALTLFVSCKIVTELGGKLFAQFVVALCIICGAYMRVHFLFQPNFLEIFWWTLIAFFIVKYINTKIYRYIYFAGLAIGLSWLSKYSILLFVTGILAGCLLTNNRSLLLKKHIYLALLVALIITLPNLAWQYTHRWPVIHHMKELRETQLRYVSPFDFLKDQLLMHLPTFFVWIGGLAWLLFSSRGKPYRMLAWIYITVIFLLIISSGKSYYSLGAYPMLFAAGAVWLESLTMDRWRWLRYASVMLTLALFIPFIPIALPVWKPAKLAAYYKSSGLSKTGILKWEDHKEHALQQDFADMLGWKEMAEKTSLAYASIPDSTKGKTMIFCRNYGQAGALTYYGKNLPAVYADNASFLLWMPDHYQLKNILLVTHHFPDNDDIVFHQFESFRIIDSVQNPLSREYGAKIILFENGNEKVNSLIDSLVRQKKDEFRR